MAKINFVYPITVSDQLPQLPLISLKAAMSALGTDFLLEKATPKLKKVRIEVGQIPTRVSYSPLTKTITVNPDKRKLRHPSEGLVPNTLFALSMAYYDSLKTSDRMYWKNLTRNERADMTFLKRISFSTEQAGKDRLLFASELTKKFLKGDSELIRRFFGTDVEELVALSRTRFRGLISNRDKNEPIVVSRSLMGEESLPLSEALDITGITGISDFLRKEGYALQLDYDESGLFVFNAVKNGQKVVQIKRSFYHGEVRNDYFAIFPELQRQGLGLKVFATQLMSSVKNGVKAINLSAERDEENGLYGYNVWWKFGFDGFIRASATNNPTEAKDWWLQAVTEKILGSSDIDLQLRFYGMISRLQDKVANGEFSPSAFRYLLDVTLDGDYQDKGDFVSPSKKDFLALVQFFNRMSPESPFLKEEGLSYQHQRIQRLMELDGFDAWWTQYGIKWEARLDLSEGERSPSIATLRDYMRQRGIK